MDKRNKDLVWNDRGHVGHDGIDRQHQMIFDLLDRTEAALRDGSASKPLVLDLTKLVLDHFAYEEEMMRAGGYPALDQHGEAHGRMREAVLAFKDAFLSGRKAEGAFQDFIEVWVQHHILGEDQALADWMRRLPHGGQATP